jgi:hypothetical protein
MVFSEIYRSIQNLLVVKRDEEGPEGVRLKEKRIKERIHILKKLL